VTYCCKCNIFLEGCSHRRSRQYFIESILKPYAFPSVPCSSYRNYLMGKCGDCNSSSTNCVYMGEYLSTKYVFLILTSQTNQKKNRWFFKLYFPPHPQCIRIILPADPPQPSLLHRHWLIICFTVCVFGSLRKRCIYYCIPPYFFFVIPSHCFWASQILMYTCLVQSHTEFFQQNLAMTRPHCTPGFAFRKLSHFSSVF